MPDYLPDYLLDYMPVYTPKYSASLLQEDVSSAIKSYLTTTLDKMLDTMLNTMRPIISPVLDRLTAALYNSPDIVVLTFFVVMLLITLQILSWIRRALMFGTRLAMRLAFYGGLVAVAASIYQRGWDASWRDAVMIGNWVLFYAGMVKNIWLREYRKYEEQAQRTRDGHSRGQAGSWRGR